MFFLKGIMGFLLCKSGLKRVIQMKKDSFINSKTSFPFYKPKTVNQEVYQRMLMDSKVSILFVLGPAGTGKTMLACNNAIRELKAGNISKIIITRPVVPVEEDIGYLPGSINKKMDPWMRPIFDIFLDFYTQREIDTMMQNNIIEISPLAYMRGRTFKNAMIIADEMQNSSPNQMLMLATRLGTNSKMVITGDLKQTDKQGTLSGLFDVVTKYRAYMKEQ
jgi:phosphate starvation-inducible PhoH-like protein